MFKELENYAKEVVEEIERRSNGEYQCASRYVVKNNDIHMLGLQVKNDFRVSPVFYLDGYFKNNISPKRVVDDILGKMSETEKVAKVCGMDDLLRYENVQDRIRLKLVSLDRNSEYLRNAVYREFMDMAVVFIIDFSGDKQYTTVVTKQILSFWDVNEDFLFNVARNNMLKYESYTFMSMVEVLKGIDANLQAEVCEGEETCNDMYILSNESRVFGAASILYPDALKEIANQVGDNLILLPSSVHEFIVMPANYVDSVSSAESLIRMVKEINCTQVAPEEVLADNAYYYDAELDKIDYLR